MKKLYIESSTDYIPNITYMLDDVGIREKSGIGRDMQYRKLITSVREAERFNYHSDYWGSAEEYQEGNVALMDSIEEYVNKPVEITFEDDETVRFKVLGLLIHRHYNSPSHSRMLIEELT